MQRDAGYRGLRGDVQGLLISKAQQRTGGEFLNSAIFSEMH
jgi:hypothetical protein